MPGAGWGEILKELTVLRNAKDPHPFDKVRRKYLAELHNHTGRATILYATQWTQPGAPAELISITDEDVHGLMEVVRGNPGPLLDLILHTPGGSPEATEAVVTYLRSKYDDIRVIIPHAAMSAGTMLACAANRIVMGRHSSLGPIDPQLLILGPNGVSQSFPAQAILDQFDKGKAECQDPANLGPWLPILSQYGPSLLVQCENAMALAQRLVGKWLHEYMFGGDPKKRGKAYGIARRLANHKKFLSHSRHISPETARKWGLEVVTLEDDQTLQDLVLSVYHATSHTFGATGAVKIIENHLGAAFIKAHRAAALQLVPEQAPPAPAQP